MNEPVVIETVVIKYFNAAKDPIPLNELLITQYGIAGFICYLLVLFIVSTVGSYIILNKIKEMNEQELIDEH